MQERAIKPEEWDSVWWTEDELFHNCTVELENLIAGHPDYDWRGLETYEHNNAYNERLKGIEEVEASILHKAEQLRKRALIGRGKKKVEASLQKFANKKSRKHKNEARKTAIRDQEEAKEIYRSSPDEWTKELMNYVRSDRKRSKSLSPTSARQATKSFRSRFHSY